MKDMDKIIMKSKILVCLFIVKNLFIKTYNEYRKDYKK
jgi:hypothetical protein